MPEAVGRSCGVCDPNATNGSATDPGAEPRADVQTQREPMAPTTHKNISFISAPASGSLLIPLLTFESFGSSGSLSTISSLS